MGCYLQSVLAGDNLQGRTDLSDGTAHGYLRAAAIWLKHYCGVTVRLFHDGDGAQQKDKLDPYLAEVLSQRRIWKVKKDKREALDGKILQKMAEFAAEGAALRDWHPDSVKYDVICMACFTGSRLSEYGQSRANPPKGSSGSTPYWSSLPSNNPNIPAKWRGTPEAFIRGDFQFFDKNGRHMSHAAAIRLKSRVAFVHIRVRYDKSQHNMVIRKFQRVNHHSFCVVRATLSLVERSLQGLCSPDEPICMFTDDRGRRHCITDNHIKQFMRRACIAAHPDERHYLRINIDLLLSHSLRITAAVLLNNAGVDLTDIQFRLRWYSDAVLAYIRDCPRTMYWISAKAFESAFQDTYSQAAASSTDN